MHRSLESVSGSQVAPAGSTTTGCYFCIAWWPVGRPGSREGRGKGEATGRFETQGLDFHFMNNTKPQIGEISDCYFASMAHACPGHWDSSLRWHEGHLWPQDAILEDLLLSVTQSRGHGLPPSPRN